VDAEGEVKSAEQVEGVLCEPAFMSEFENSGRFFWQKHGEVFEAVKVLVEAWGKLIQNRAEFFFEQGGAVKKSAKGISRVFEFFDMGDESIGLDGVSEILRSAFVPSFYGSVFGLLVEGVVDFNGVEVLRVVIEPFVFF